DNNPECLDLVNKLKREWEQDNYHETLLGRLSFVPRPALQWGLRIMRVLQEARARRAPLIRRYSNPRTNLRNDPLVTDELRSLAEKEQLRLIAQSFKVIPEQSQRRILEAIGIDRKDGVLSQGIWLILPPFVDYLLLLQGRPSVKPKRDRAY